VDVLVGHQGNERKRVAVLFAYPAHLVIVIGASGPNSADYPGAAIHELNRILRGDDSIELHGVLVFAQGCGRRSPRPGPPERDS